MYFEGVQHENKTNIGRSHEARFGYIPSSLGGAPTGLGVSIHFGKIILNY